MNEHKITFWNFIFVNKTFTRIFHVTRSNFSVNKLTMGEIEIFFNTQKVLTYIWKIWFDNFISFYVVSANQIQSLKNFCLVVCQVVRINKQAKKPWQQFCTKKKVHLMVFSQRGLNNQGKIRGSKNFPTFFCTLCMLLLILARLTSKLYKCIIILLWFIRIFLF